MLRHVWGLENRAGGFAGAGGAWGGVGFRRLSGRGLCRGAWFRR